MARRRERYHPGQLELPFMSELEKPMGISTPFPEIKPAVGTPIQLTFDDLLKEPAPKPELNTKAVEKLGLRVDGSGETMKVHHPLIRGMDYREYQVSIAASTVEGNVLAILPTGLGKTNIAVLAAAKRLSDSPEKKVLVLAPTKPLVDQHERTFSDQFREMSVGVLTGREGAEKRQASWNESDIIIATPQTIANDLRAGRIRLEDVSLLVIDETHLASKDYPYVEIAEKFRGKGIILGLTASPGSGAERILGICRSLGVPASGIEVRTREDRDVAPYVQYTERNLVKVARQEIGQVDRLIREMYRSALKELKEKGFINRETPVNSLKAQDIRHIGEEIGKRMRGFEGGYSEEKGRVLQAWSSYAEAMKLSFALRVLSTHGVYTTMEYLHSISKDSTQASERIFSDIRMTRAKEIIGGMLEEKRDSPKMEKLLEIAEGYRNGKAIVFTEYRKTAEEIQDRLTAGNFQAKRFIGQGKAGGMTQREQAQTLEEFRQGRFNVLVATSVGEMGLDIPEVDAVIFFEPVPDERRLEQRIGRTGRQREGKAYILMAEGSADEPIYWESYWKWQKMQSNIRKIKTSGQ